MSDGDLSNVNPSLLKLCQDPHAWKEARKKALQERVFAKTAAKSEGVSALAFLPKEDPDERSGEEGKCAKSTATQLTAKADEGFVLDQILKHKRQRDEKGVDDSVAAAPPKPTPPTDASLSKQSMKDKLLERLRKQ